MSKMFKIFPDVIIFVVDYHFLLLDPGLSRGRNHCFCFSILLIKVVYGTYRYMESDPCVLGLTHVDVRGDC